MLHSLFLKRISFSSIHCQQASTVVLAPRQRSLHNPGSWPSSFFHQWEGCGQCVPRLSCAWQWDWKKCVQKIYTCRVQICGRENKIVKGGGGEGGVIPSVTLKIGRTSWSALSSVPARRTQHIFALMKNALDIINFKFSVLSFWVCKVDFYV